MVSTDIITHPAFIWSVIGIFIILPLSWLFVTVVTSFFIFRNTLTKRGKKTWARKIPTKISTDSQRMYAMGIAWSKENAEYKKDVHIVRDGLNLYGEYYDFGKDRCAVILSGRTESLIYGYYFAIPYANNDCNILVLDPRGHGLSDGKINTVGYEESLDDIAWLNFMQEEFGVKSVILHGICIGAAGGMFAVTNESCPKIIDGIVTDGMHPYFLESVKNHVIEYKMPTFLICDLVDFWMKLYTGHSMKKGPLHVIDKLDKPLLMLHSKKDIYSTPEFAEKLYERAGCENKKLVWFENAKHSYLRITDQERYDSAIACFLEEVYGKKEAAVKENAAASD